ncbi:MAG TPA: ribonuclease PH [Thermoanaerobaculia bacterium]|nr:ribonuclease PH [Thermoanaerobaculia bacterium]
MTSSDEPPSPADGQSPPSRPSPPSRRPGGRADDALRPFRIETGVQKFAEGSALVELGDTRVLVAASVEGRVPSFLKESGRGWLTAEYSMLPRATHTRSAREVSQGRPSGRTAEIQRLIGRSLRAAVNLKAMPDRTLTLDCDVLQADGGTRTAAVTGAYVAAALALGRLLLSGDIQEWPLVEQLAAVSVGIVGGQALLDLEYVEDQVAEVDMNVVATAGGSLVEIQGTGERRSFTRREMDALIDLALAGIGKLAAAQSEALATTLAEVAEVRARGRRRHAPAKPEKDLWGPP